MLELGYALSSEEFGPPDLITNARTAESVGFQFALISDHFHPWTNQQPHSPFVWSVIGGISQAVKNLSLGTGVTCPLMRYNPAIIAQAAATSAVMMPGRFFLGLGTGENLNEHITGKHWPPAPQRQEMLEEAVAVMRLLWQGGWQTHRGNYYTVEQARIFTMPAEPPPIMIAASKPGSAELAGRIADGLISTVPKRELVKRFEQAGGKHKPRYGQVTVCYASSEDEAAHIVRKQWPNAGIDAPLMTDLPLPKHFETVAESMQPDKITEDVILGPDPRRHIDAIKKFVDAGYDHVYVHQIGPQQSEFLHFYADKVLPHFKVDSKSSNGSSNGSKRKTRHDNHRTDESHA
ncbi:MAG: TIGR03557 family F420-dependent LLM class oxidoreductase [Candidatus Binatus sp.]|uniref:TIGR03557 family F420-dependent LLM class oxidoreductase n=1 Tax=Candidatus Binatus sp. TaxID=2811406 RepID=UPI003BB213A3